MQDKEEIAANSQPNHYQNQNQILRELHEERMRKKKQEKPSDMHDCLEIKPELKQIPIIEEIKEQKEKQKAKIPLQRENLFLNSLFYDTREKKPNFFMKIFSLFNEQPRTPRKTISSNVQSIFISTFGFETQTFEHLLATSKVKLVLLNDSENVGENKVIKQYGGFKNLTVVLKGKSQVQKYGVFHAKLWFVKFKTFLRVVICTSNQHTYDWAVWENAFWYQDFPLKETGQTHLSQNKENKNASNFDFKKDFEETLTEVVTAMLPLSQLEQLSNIKLTDYEFKDVKVILIPSIPGRHVGENMKKQGIGKVKEVMKKFNKMKNPVVTYQSTSLGILESQFIEELYLSLCPSKDILQQPRFRLIYPTKKYIEQQTGGQAQVLFFTSQNYEKSDAKGKILHKFDTNQNNPIFGCIPHLKAIIIEEEKEQNNLGILYVGSHNMTKAAWGKFEKQKSQLYIANSELGVMFLDVDLQEFKQWSPFKYPPEPYRQNDVPFLRILK